jgi:uncharacterized protein (DUF1778 family)
MILREGVVVWQYKTSQECRNARQERVSANFDINSVKRTTSAVLQCGTLFSGPNVRCKTGWPRACRIKILTLKSAGVHCLYNDKGGNFMATTQQKRNHRIGFRATPEAENLIRAGAKVRGVNVSEFILECACTRAEQIIADQTTFKLSSSQWKAFTDALDRPPLPKPRLKRLLSEPSVAESR